MSVRYLRSMVAIGESLQPQDIIEQGESLLFKVKVFDLPGPSRNGILYPLDEMEEALRRDRFRQMIATRCMYGEHDHPPNPEDLNRWSNIDMNNTSFKWNKIWIENGSLWGQIQTVPINGDLMYKCIKAGELPSVSIRVIGEQSPSDSGAFIKLTNIHLITIDWVRYPGNPDSFVKDASSFEILKTPMYENPEVYRYKGITASGESMLLDNGLIAKGEKVFDLGNGLFAVSEVYDKNTYENMKAFRISAF